MAMPATQIRRGMVLVFNGEPCRVVEFRHHTPGNLRAMVQAKLKNLRTGSNFEHRFRAVNRDSRLDALVEELDDADLALVFVRTKRGADRLVKRLRAHGTEAAAIHGDKSQSQRERALERFHAGRTHTLVA